MTISPYASLAHKDFRRILLAHGTLTVAREAQIVVVGWQVYELTRDPLTLGLIGLAEALPFIGIALYAGHVADRATRRTIAIGGTFALLVSAVALLMLTITPGAITAGRVWPVYLVVALSATARSFMRPRSSRSPRKFCRASSMRTRSRGARRRGISRPSPDRRRAD